jgi:probable O-glycosylation ligase (exosortase A-associated)
MPASGRRGGLAMAEQSQYEPSVGVLPIQEQAPAARPDERAKLTVTLVGLVLYLFVITSNRVPLGEASIIIAAGGLLVNPTSLKLPPYLKWLLAFAVWVSIAATQSTYPSVVAESVTTLWKLVIIVFIATNALRTRPQVRLFMVSFLACFMLFPVRGALSNFFIYHNDVQGRAIWNFVYSNPNDLGAMAMLQLSMALTIAAAEPKGWIRRAAYLSVLLLVFLILLTQSRGVFIGLILFVAMLIAGQRRRLRLIVRLAVVAVILVALAPSSVWERLGTLRHATTVQTLDEVDGEEGSARQRWEIWRVATKIIREHPVYGVGLGAYKNYHRIYALQSEFNPTARGGRDTHSLYLNVLAETGYIGLALYLGMLTAIFMAAERTRRKCKRVLSVVAARQFLFLEAGLVAFLTAAIFGSLPYLPHLLLHLVLLQVLAVLYRREVEAQSSRQAQVTERFLGTMVPAEIA